VARSRSLRPVAASVRETPWETRRAGPRAGGAARIVANEPRFARAAPGVPTT